MFRNCLNIMKISWQATRLVPDTTNLVRPQFLASPMAILPPNMVQQVRTFKDKDVLKLRCKSCYFKKIDDRWYVLCNQHGRHKQRQKLSWIQKHDRMIVTHITRTGSYLKKHYQYPHHDI